MIIVKDGPKMEKSKFRRRLYNCIKRVKV